MVVFPDDVKMEWLNVIRRMQSALKGNEGYAIITVTVIVGADNRPVVWDAPQCRKLEPRDSAGATLMEIARQLSTDH